jgi:hypothetical protein
MNADADPIGAIVATRADVSVSDIRQGGDFWNITSVWSETVPAKLRALGISEGFLSGEATYSNADSALSVFIEQLRAYREMLTRKIFYDKLFPLISVVNGFFNDKKVAAKFRNKNQDPEEILAELQDNSALLIPQIHWHKQLKPEGDTEYIGMLNTLTEAGVPVSLRAMAAAGGLSLDQLVSEMEEDYKVRAAITKKKSDIAPAEDASGGGGGDYDESSDMGSRLTTLGYVDPNNPYVSAVYRKLQAGGRKPGSRILEREYGSAAELTGYTKTGKRTLLVDQRSANEKINKAIARAAVRAHNNAVPETLISRRGGSR